MRIRELIVLLVFISATALAGDAPTSAPASAPTSAPSSPDTILAEIDALPRPDFDRSREGDEAYVKAYTDRMNATWDRQAELELMFYRRYPRHAQAESLLIRRWNNQLTRGHDPKQISAEVDQYLKDHPDGPTDEDALENFTRLQSRLAEGDPDRLLALAHAFAKRQPHNEQGADYFLLAAQAIHDPQQRDQMLQQIITEYPNSPGAISAGGFLRRQSQIGMPFELGFFDVTSGEWIHTRQLRGKVVVVDFWATWCAPCVGEIPHLQKLYTQYKDRGLEILGVSLDGPRCETTLDTLKKFIAEHHIPWPQYYQGEAFDSGFSSSWGVRAIPTVFVIDQSGRLYSTDAREKLGDILAKLLPPPNGQ